MPSRTKKRKSKKRSVKSNAEASDYQFVVRWSAADECYLAEAPALQGCVTHASSPAAALKAGYTAARLWLDDAAKRGEYIPPPRRRLSGKMTLRLPVSLHEEIAREAEREGVSINQWVLMKLAS